MRWCHLGTTIPGRESEKPGCDTRASPLRIVSPQRRQPALPDAAYSATSSPSTGGGPAAAPGDADGAFSLMRCWSAGRIREHPKISLCELGAHLHEKKQPKWYHVSLRGRVGEET